MATCAELLEAKARQIAKLDPQNTGAMSRAIRNLNDTPTLFQKIQEAMYGNILSGLSTQVDIGWETLLTNVFGQIEKAIAVPVGMARQAITGETKASERYTLGDIGSSLKGAFTPGISYDAINKGQNIDIHLGIIHALKDYVDVWLQAFKDPTSVTSSHQVIPKIGAQVGAPEWEKVLGNIWRIPMKMISGTDAMMQLLGQRLNLGMQANIAIRRAIEAGALSDTPEARALFWKQFMTGPNRFAMTDQQINQAKAAYPVLLGRMQREAKLTGQAPMTEDQYIDSLGRATALQRAYEEGLRANFTNRSAVATAASRFMNDKAPFLKFLVPFVTVPANTFRWATERLPGIGLLYKESQRELTQGKTFREILRRIPEDDLSAVKAYTGMDVDNVIARQTFGLGVVAAGMWLVNEGYITPGPPLNSAEETVRSDAGVMPYSFSIGGQSITYLRPHALGMLLSLSADLGRLYKLAGTALDKQDQQSLVDVTHAIGNIVGYNLVENGMLSNLGLFIQTATDIQRYGPRFLNQMAGMAIPTLQGHIANAFDPNVREIHGVIDYLKNKSGIGRTDLPIQQNILGEPRRIGEPLWPGMALTGGKPVFDPSNPTDAIFRGMLQLIDPYKATVISSNPVMQKMTALGLTTKHPSQELKMFPEVKEKLSDEQYQFYSNERARALNTGSLSLLQSYPSLFSLDNTTKLDDLHSKQVLTKLATEASRAAKSSLLQKWPSLYESQAAKFKAQLQEQGESKLPQGFRQ